MESTTSMPLSENVYLTTSKFDSCDDLLKSVREFYYSKGYGISIRGSRKDKHVILQCDRGGLYRDIRGISGKRKKTTGSRLINCPFKLLGKRSSDGAWIFDVKDLSHNHEPSTDISGHPSFRQLPSESIKSVKEMTKAGTPPRQILSSLHQQTPNLPVISRNIYNVKRKIRRENLRNRPMINALFEELDEGGFIYDISQNAEGWISRLFIAHPLSIKLAKAFSNIFLMDCTYKTNKYNMPLLDIIGVSCFNTAFYSGFVFLEREDEENYSWALRAFKEIIGQDPCVIMSDRELALINAIKKVFPTTSNLLCVWNIEKNVLANCKKYFGRAEEFDIFMSDWNNVVYSTTEALFEENWFEFTSIHKEKKDAIEYIKNVWLPWKEKFVSAWTDKYLHFGNRSSSRVEGAHDKLKQYLQVSTGDLREVKEKICLVVEHEFNEIKVKLSSEKIHVHHDGTMPLFRELHYHVSHFALKEIYKKYGFTKDGSMTPCTGHYMATMGLPCAHKIKYWQGTTFPLDLIHPQWRIDTLSLNSQNDLHDENTGRLDELLNELRSTYQRWPLNKKKHALSLITELLNQSDAFFEPVVQRPKGRPPKSKKKGGITSTTRDPSRFELIESSQRRNEANGENNLFDLNVYPLDTFDLDGPF
ncbi:PKS-NRPS hybrid synthetase cheA-like [Lactuca sativa]|nr:PKS-NRPS hybrid synthetase cheA-like [Lactuca sativa]